MLLIVKRGGIIFIVLMLILCMLLFSIREETASTNAADSVVIIDAGHGAPDGGAVGKSGVLEKDLNLAVAKLLEQKLSESGQKVIMTRTEDKGLYKKEDASLRDKKREDMKLRASIANTMGASCFVSIHMNQFTDPKYSGPQVFYAANAEGSEELAEEIRRSFFSEIGPHCTREIKPVSKDLYLLRNAKNPAVIVECGFLSNPEEEALLKQEAYQEKVANAIFLGIQNFIKAE